MSQQMTFFAPVTQVKPTNWPADYQERFWREYPVKISKRAAMRALEKVKDRCAEWDLLIDGVRRYAIWMAQESPTTWRPHVKHPATWLNADCWEDDLPRDKPRLMTMADIAMGGLRGDDR